jgi:peptidyl-prolyl cis-trans isomerase D
MQIIQKIRDKGAAIGFVVIALSLIAFILMDAKQGSSRLFSSNSTSLGKVNGQEIDNNEFNDEVKLQQDKYGDQSGAMVYRIRQGVWDEMVEKIVLNDEFIKLGLTFSPKEMMSIMFSNNAPNELKQAFTDKATGQYDISKAEAWWPTVKKLKDDQKAKLESEIIEPMKLQALYTKYSSMLAASAYYPTWLQQKETAENKKFATISYVAVPYNVINDSSIKVSDDEITDYVKNHAAAYKQDGGRFISYVSFNASPSADDTTAIVKTIDDLKAPFIADTNAKLFLERNLSAIEYDDTYSEKSKITASKKDSIIGLANGKVFGPYLDGSNILLAKKLGEKEVPDTVKCRHILISTTDPQSGQPILDDSVAKKRIDSIAAAIKGGADFNSLVVQYSGDSGSVHKGGEYTFGYADFKSLAKEFAETIFYGKTGDKKVVHTNFGWHYIEVLDQKNPQPAYQIAYLAKEILPSDETVTAASSQATKLSGEAQDEKSMDAYIAKNGLRKIKIPVMVKSSDYQLGSMQDARQLIKWAFDAKEGDVSEPFSIGDQYVVGIVDKIQPEGLPDAATARPLVEQLIRNLKKADQITTQLGANPSLESTAKAYNGSIQTAGNDSSLIFGAQIINGLGQEPKVIGAAFNKDFLGKVSPPIAGMNGVYVMQVNSVGDKPADLPQVAAQQTAQRIKTLQQEMYGWFESLKKMATIKDDRNKFL